MNAPNPTRGARMKKQETTYSEIKGLITDVNINVNPGNPTFQNFYKTPIGKLAKRKGWINPYYWYNEGVGNRTSSWGVNNGKDVGNIKIDYTRLVSGAGGYPDTATFHYKSFKDKLLVQTGETIAGEWQYIIQNKIVNNTNELWAARTGHTRGQVTPYIKKISSETQWTGRGNTKFIDTPDHVYIFNDFQDGQTTRNVLKYKYDKDNINGNYDLDECDEVQIDSNLKCGASNGNDWIINAEIKSFDAATVPGTIYTGIGIGKYNYIFLPVYNTGAVGDPIFRDQLNIVNGVVTSKKSYYQTVKIPGPVNTKYGVSFKCKFIANPFIIGINIYRTKNIELLNAETEKYYFVGFATKPLYTTTTATGSAELVFGKSMYYSSTTSNFYGDVSNDDALGNQIFQTFPINLDAPLRASCGCYAQNRLFVAGDRRHIENVFFSEPDKTDLFINVGYTLELVSGENEVKTIIEVGIIICVFLKHSIYILRPTSDPDVPFIKELLSPTVGCDSLNSACTLDTICYFIFNNKLWAINEYGQYKEISAAINTLFKDKDDTSEIILKPNASDRYIKIMFRKSDGDAVNIDYYPIHDFFTEQTGDKDIYTVSGVNATLVSQDDRYKLVNYEQIPDLNEEWGVDIDGNIVKRGTDYQDVSVGSDKVTWLNYTADSILAIKTYPINAVLEKPWAFSATVKANCVVIYGTGPIDVASAKDGEEFSEYKTYTMTRTGITIPLNLVGHIISVRLRHTANTDIDYDFMKLVYTPFTSVDVTNDVAGGE